MSTINPSDEQAVAKRFLEFKEMLILLGKLKENDPVNEDVLLMRFLRARQYSIPLATQMFTECEEWRQKMDVDGLVNSYTFEENELVSKIYPRFYHKTDKIGRSIYIERLCKLDVENLFKATTKERLIKHLVREFEKYTRYRLPACALKSGKNIFQGLVILDLLDAPLSQFNSIRLLIQDLSSISSNYYPETLGKMIIINAPWLFTAIWSVVYAMLDEKTSAKISVLGADYQKSLLDLIDEKNLPSFLGGSCNCPGGCENSDIGPWNDGTVDGFPQPFWESFEARDREKKKP